MRKYKLYIRFNGGKREGYWEYDYWKSYKSLEGLFHAVKDSKWMHSEIDKIKVSYQGDSYYLMKDLI